jgi:putative flippase GtrA
MISTAAAGLMQRPVVRQFVKFCIIGFSSMLIDVAISYQLTYSLHLNTTLAKTISFLFAVTNGFIWNSAWTFRGMGSGPRHKMYVKFMLVNCIGLILNLTIFKSVLFLFTGRFIGQGTPDKAHFFLATGTAVICVSLWNFFANKKWTYGNTLTEGDLEQYPVS